MSACTCPTRSGSYLTPEGFRCNDCWRVIPPTVGDDAPLATDVNRAAATLDAAPGGGVMGRLLLAALLLTGCASDEKVQCTRMLSWAQNAQDTAKALTDAPHAYALPCNRIIGRGVR